MLRRTQYIGAKWMTKFGERLRMLRTGRHWSQERLGFDLGVGKATISKWENGVAEPNLGQLLAIKRLFEEEDVSLDYLIDDDVAVRAGLDGHEGAAAFAGLRPPLNEDELLLLSRYRQLNARQRRSLLSLLAS